MTLSVPKSPPNSTQLDKREIPESIESTPPPPPSTEIKEASKKQKRMRQRKEKDQIPSERLNGYDARPKS